MNPLAAIAMVSIFALDRPEVARGRLELMGAPSNLSEDLKKREGWVGYAVPRVPGSDGDCGRVVRLDDDRGWESRVESESVGELFVISRVEGGRVVSLRTLSSGCRIDAGSRTILWWEPVPASHSLAFLSGLVSAPGEELREDAIHAVALHADPRADEILDQVAASASSFEAREKAVFWLGAVRGEEGFRRLSARFDAEGSAELREKIVFALHLSKGSGATAKLVRIARSDREGEVREKALFWLAQKAGKEATRAIASAVREDHELEVKKKAVFALSQLPEEEGVPLLIEVAETHPQPEVRKQAFFWLGQSKDPRAIALFEKVLLRKMKPQSRDRME
jgi:HEAT repeat protein